MVFSCFWITLHISLSVSVPGILTLKPSWDSEKTRKMSFFLKLLKDILLLCSWQGASQNWILDTLGLHERTGRLKLSSSGLRLLWSECFFSPNFTVKGVRIGEACFIAWVSGRALLALAESASLTKFSCRALRCRLNCLNTFFGYRCTHVGVCCFSGSFSSCPCQLVIPKAEILGTAPTEWVACGLLEM